jgi:signal peptidase II
VRRAWPRAGAVLLAVLVVDQTTKALARGAVERGGEDPILPALKLVNVRNEGVAFGIDPGATTLVVALVAFALLVLMLWFVRHATRPLVWLPVGLLLGGALGNIVDRIREGAVTDFLKLPGWPAFNLADVSITVGVIALILVMERGDRTARDDRDEEEPGAAAPSGA